MGAWLASLSLCALAPAASAEQVSFQQVTPVGSYDAVPEYSEGRTSVDYVTPDGSSVFFSTIGPFPGLPNTGGRLDILRASRGAGGTWSTTWMSPGASTLFLDNIHDRVFEAASRDGTRMIFESRDQLDPSRVDCGGGMELEFEHGEVCRLRVYEYDSSTGVTTLISRASVQPNTLFDARFASASPDLGTVSWLTPEAMTPGVADQNSIDVYSAQGGTSALVSAASGSTGSVSAKRFVHASNGGPGIIQPFEQPGGLQDEYGVNQQPARDAHLVSADGSEVFFQDVRQLSAAAPGPGIENVYMRRGTTTTLVSSAAQRTLPTTVGPFDSFFGDATADGRSVFFETASQLTDGDGNASVDVYRYDVPSGQVSLVSALGTTQSAAAAGTGSYYVSASADGSHVYFASRDDLDPNSAPAGEAWKLYERVGARTRFIALVPEFSNFVNGAADETTTNLCGGIATSAGGHEEAAHTISAGGCDAVATMRATADGSRLIFESAQPLTPDATSGLRCVTASESSFTGGSQTGGIPGQGCNIYSYDDATGTITLLSPGTSTFGAFLKRLPFPSTLGANDQTAPLNQPLSTSADGSRVFFLSKDALVPGAVSGLQNIYAWSAGALILVSPPNETSDAIYDGNSSDGSQIFFHSRQSLIPGADNHGQFAIYDAQLGDPPPAGPADPPSAPQPLAAAPAQSLTVNAAAVAAPAALPPLIPAKQLKQPKPLTRAQKLSKALKACKKDKLKSKRLLCEKSARKKYASRATTKK